MARPEGAKALRAIQEDLDEGRSLPGCHQESMSSSILTLSNKVATICQELYDNPPFPDWKKGLQEVWN